MIELLIEILLEGVLQAVFEIVVEFAGRGLLSKFTGRRVHPVIAGLTVLFLGAAIGLASVAVAPDRLLPSSRIPGASLILSPVVAGVFMEYFGRWRRGSGGSPSIISTFWGGALFAFGLALARFLLLTDSGF